MTRPAANFDRLAAIYRSLEFLAFGGDLERARFGLLDGLTACRSILVLGEGDGRCLARLVEAAPHARIHCIDSSRAMLARAESRLAGRPARDRVTFECADVLAKKFPAANYDAVVTLFFLDCFDAPTASEVVRKVSGSLQPRAHWLYADFAMPEGRLARWRARLWLALLYAFFRWQTGLRTRELPPAEALIRSAGFTMVAARSFQAGLLRSVLFERLNDTITPQPARS